MDTATKPTAETTENEPDYYAILGVSPDVAPDELRRAYGEAAKTSMTSDRARFAAIGDAFELLKDPAKRAAYDRRRRLTPPRPARRRNRKPRSRRLRPARPNHNNPNRHENQPAWTIPVQHF